MKESKKKNLSLQHRTKRVNSTHHKPKRKRKSTADKDPWSLVERNHYRCLRLGQFFDIAYPPKVSDVEIVVCFADLRGFTAYCHALQKVSLDNRIQNFLKDYFKIYSLSVLNELWKREPSEGWTMPVDQQVSGTQLEAEIREILVPVTYKNLGDGVMLVWEVPNDASISVQGMAMHAILQIVFNIFNRFKEKFHSLSMAEVDAYSQKVTELNIGFGLARGHAWKLDFGHHMKFDYAGSIVNLAARLQDQARPEGIVCQYEFSQALFDRMIKKRVGRAQLLKTIKGIGSQKVIFLSSNDIKKDVVDYI